MNFDRLRRIHCRLNVTCLRIQCSVSLPHRKEGHVQCCTTYPYVGSRLKQEHITIGSCYGFVKENSSFES
ncbi:hypothetical protein VNO77_41930 [Canavalia gladiata]|uniref:Uncharacterized protein n=1 Tax=Canavalia gladiata TaxID=3824 RepID=A0AAN9PSX6_CANGL